MTDESSRIAALEADLLAAKRKLRDMSIALSAAIILSALSCAMVALPLLIPRVIRAAGLSIVDKAGKESARIMNGPKGATLVFHAPNSGDVVLVGALGDGSGVAVIEDGDVRLRMSAGGELSPAFSASDRNGKTGVILGVDDRDGNSHLLLTGAAGRAIMTTGGPGLRVVDKCGKELEHRSARNHGRSITYE